MAEIASNWYTTLDVNAAKQLTIPAMYKSQTFLLTKLEKKTELNFYLFNHSVQLCKLYCVELI
jgi:hypothetical protein